MNLFFAAAGGSAAVFLVDADFFFEALLFATRSGRGGGFGGGVANFVTFPSDARSLFREVDFTLYLDLRLFC